jgi:hypothetical protein
VKWGSSLREQLIGRQPRFEASSRAVGDENPSFQPPARGSISPQIGPLESTGSMPLSRFSVGEVEAALDAVAMADPPYLRARRPRGPFLSERTSHESTSCANEILRLQWSADLHSALGATNGRKLLGVARIKTKPPVCANPADPPAADPRPNGVFRPGQRRPSYRRSATAVTTRPCSARGFPPGR